MNNYFVIYRVPAETMANWMERTSPEERQKQGQEIGNAMMAWMQKNEASIVERGWPLGKTKTVARSGIADGKNDLNYACIVRADSHEAAAKLFEDSPHLTIPNSYIDVMEIPHMGL